jgi:DNA polymerase III epsilon subunit-like protein
MYFIYDCETSGLPQFTRFRGYYDPRELDKYDSARLVSISWILLDDKLEIVDKQTHLIKPDNFIIPQESIDIHHITNERANAEGKNIHDVLNIIMDIIKPVKTVVAHNVYFDVNVLKSECYRYSYPAIINTLDKSYKYCTMAKAKELLALPRNPKLSLLYTILYDKEMENAHDAEYDTYYCYKCFQQLCYLPKRDPTEDIKKQQTRNKRTADQAGASSSSSARPPVSRKEPKFTIDDKEITLNEEQAQIVFDDPKKNILIVACAGSGKSSTIVCRIKHLVDTGTPESSIVLTTFTKDAANDMEKKLISTFGYKPAVIVGTIDSIALKYVKKYQPELLNDTTNNVGEYAIQFLNFLKSTNAKEVFLKGITHLVIDEFQDINDVQYKIIKEFYKNDTNIIAVGDDAQNIYTFRGSNVKYILNFHDYFENAVQYKLTTNFRSSQDIVSFANGSIENNDNQIPKTMKSYDPIPSGIRPKIHYYEKSKQQYNFVRDKIKEYINSGYKLCQIAILCPQNSFLYQLEEILTKDNIPNILLDGKCDVRTRIKNEHVCLSTIHKSKGLEWDIVFLIMMNDQVFPSKKYYQDICESRRLFYVGITRPKSILHIAYSPIFDCSYICRFVSELDRNLYEFHNYKPECIGLSKNSIKLNKLTVTSMIETLDGEDYVALKKSKILYDFDQEEHQLYSSYTYKPFIVDNDLYADFGIFIDTLITRMIGELYNKSGGLFNESAASAISCLKMDFQENLIYQKYKINFLYNLPSIAKIVDDDIFDNMRLILSIFVNKKYCPYVKPVDSNDISLIINIIHKLYEKSKKFNLSIDKIPIFTKAFLPKDFEMIMSNAMRTYSDSNISWTEIISSIWDISKCDLIVKDKRRRLLYKDIQYNEVITFMDLYEDMYNYIIPFIISYADNTNNVTIKCHESYRSNKNNILGEYDLRIDDIIYDYKVSNDEKVKAEHILQLLCYKQLYEENTDKIINKIGVINPLKGKITIIDVSNYTQGSNLLDYLVVKNTN